jgi:hypothetical protein
MNKRRMARVVNPAPRRARVVNPYEVADAISSSDGELSDVKEIFEEFRGKPSEYTTDQVVGPGVPLTLAELGGLQELELDDGMIYGFDPEETRLCSDAQGNLHIAGHREIDDEMQPGEYIHLGEVVRCDYIADKPHLYPAEKEQRFTHTFGDDVEGARGPELYYRDGYLIPDPETGDYEVSPEGIIDVEPGSVRNGFFSSLTGSKFEVEGYGKPKLVERAPTLIGTYRARSKEEAIRLAKADAGKGRFTKFKAIKVNPASRTNGLFSSIFGDRTSGSKKRATAARSRGAKMRKYSVEAHGKYDEDNNVLPASIFSAPNKRAALEQFKKYLREGGYRVSDYTLHAFED